MTHDRGGVDGLTGAGGVPMTEHERRLGGLDFALRYVPLRDNQFRSFTWGTELLCSDNRYSFDPDGKPGNGDEFNRDVGALGLYSYMTYKFHRQWSAGFLFDWVEERAERARPHLRVLAVHHVGAQPLEPTALAVHAHRTQRRVGLAQRRCRLSAMGLDHRRALTRLATTLSERKLTHEIKTLFHVVVRRAWPRSCRRTRPKSASSLRSLTWRISPATSAAISLKFAVSRPASKTRTACR